MDSKATWLQEREKRGMLIVSHVAHAPDVARQTHFSPSAVLPPPWIFSVLSRRFSQLSPTYSAGLELRALKTIAHAIPIYGFSDSARLSPRSLGRSMTS